MCQGNRKLVCACPESFACLAQLCVAIHVTICLATLPINQPASTTFCFAARPAAGRRRRRAPLPPPPEWCPLVQTARPLLALPQGVSVVARLSRCLEELALVEKRLDELPYPNLTLVQGVAAGIDPEAKVGGSGATSGGRWYKCERRTPWRRALPEGSRA